MQRAASLLTTGVLKSTPQSALGVLLNQQTLDILAQFLATRIPPRLREAGGWPSSRLGHVEILNISISRNVLDEVNRIFDYTSTFFDFNNIDDTITDRDAWAGDETPLEGLAIYLGEDDT